MLKNMFDGMVKFGMIVAREMGHRLILVLQKQSGKIIPSMRYVIQMLALMVILRAGIKRLRLVVKKFVRKEVIEIQYVIKSVTKIFLCRFTA